MTFLFINQQKIRKDFREHLSSNPAEHASGSIQSYHIASGAIQSNHLGSGVIYPRHISEDAIRPWHIASGAVKVSYAHFYWDGDLMPIANKQYTIGNYHYRPSEIWAWEGRIRMLPILHGQSHEPFLINVDNSLAYAIDRGICVYVSGQDTFDWYHSNRLFKPTTGEPALQAASGALPITIEIHLSTVTHYWAIFGLSFTYGRYPNYVKIEWKHYSTQTWHVAYEASGFSGSVATYMPSSPQGYVDAWRITIDGINNPYGKVQIGRIFGYTTYADSKWKLG